MFGTGRRVRRRVVPVAGNFTRKPRRSPKDHAAPARSGRGALRSSTLTRVGNAPELAIEEIVAKRPADRAERELLPRDLVLPEEPHFEALGSGSEVEIDEPRAKHHVDLADVRQADHRVQVADDDARARFLERFPHGAGGDGLAVLEKAGGKRPQTVARLDRAPAQQHLILPFGQAADDDLRILVVDRAARRTDEPRQVVTLRDSPLDAAGAAGAAELDERRGGNRHRAGLRDVAVVRRKFGPDLMSTAIPVPPASLPSCPQPCPLRPRRIFGGMAVGMRATWHTPRMPAG